jgi:hypothetical protein
MTQAKLQRWIGIAAVLNLAMIALLLGRPHFTNASRPVRGIKDPMIAMEMVRDASEVDLVLSDAPSPDREVLRIKQYAGFAFIACYAALFVAMAFLLAPRKIAIAAGVVGVVAAIFNVIENLGILRIVDVDLSHTTQAMIDAARYPSLIKWTLASLALGLFGMLALRSAPTGLKLVGACYAIAALLGLFSLLDLRILAWTGVPTLAGLLGLAILYLRPFRVGSSRPRLRGSRTDGDHRFG